MSKYETLQGRPKKTYRIKFSGCVDVIGHCELEAKAGFESLTLCQIPFKDIEWIRELDDGEKAEFGDHLTLKKNEGYWDDVLPLLRLISRTGTKEETAT